MGNKQHKFTQLFFFVITSILHFLFFYIRKKYENGLNITYTLYNLQVIQSNNNNSNKWKYIFNKKCKFWIQLFLFEM